ncbi:hypothetical protein CONPUDRAFT_108040 [Coniophora puteana RWD-64-598 SS2]|uniref:FAD-binding domain-containing protein n=1 Tax=Coniophora puteana (strain RWD-64-598) TaxID=741705 RepID=A0A5M3MG98_CONPW|nr:uncharacterized protein CONPUDRAFT_108040 [Coniophora puteana RWD-64-598 SS2]EIW78242.1 hypothetical protein CONPUDRAFT_108040 [Coniophora puteana RWD-64-598 SS2]
MDSYKRPAKSWSIQQFHNYVVNHSPNSTNFLMMASPQVLIVGAGPVGLVAALALLRNGLSVRVIEKASAPHIGQRGSGNFPRTLEVYHFLGVPEIDREAIAVPLIHTHAAGSLEVLKELPMTPRYEPTPAIPFISPKVIGQNNVERILSSHIQKLGCTVEYGAELRSFEQDEEGVVAQIVIRDGDKETTSTIRSQFLIGADGARGVVRKQLGLTFLGETRDTIRVVTGDIRFKCSGLSRTCFEIFNYDAGDVVILRPTDEIKGGDGWQLITLGARFGVDTLLSDKEALYSAIRETLNSPVDFLELVWISEFRPNIRMVDHFGQGRVFVAGDAAHVHPPTGGQGLNSGVQDAFNLAWKIALVAKGISPLSFLDSYTAERLPVIAQMLNITTTLLDKTFGPKRGTIESAMERGRILFMLGVNYRTSPIVLDEFSAGIPPVPAYQLDRSDELVAGDRAPDAPGLVEGSATVRLFDIFKPTHHTALVFAPDVQVAAEMIVKSFETYSAFARPVVILPASASSGSPIPSARVVIDKENYGRTHYLIKDEPRIIIVRPDGVVGAIVAGPLGVHKYFGLIQGH